MKKIYLAALGFLLSIPLLISDALGITLDDFRQQVYRPENLPSSETGNVGAETKVTNILDFLINLVLYASGSVAVLMLVYGAVRLISSAGNPEQKEEAVKVIRWAIIGLFVVILAFALVTNIIDLIFRATT